MDLPESAADRKKAEETIKEVDEQREKIAEAGFNEQVSKMESLKPGKRGRKPVFEFLGPMANWFGSFRAVWIGGGMGK